MKLSDVMGAADLAVFAEVALVLFVGAFVVVLVRMAWPGENETSAKLGRMPLDDDDGRIKSERSAL